MSPSILNGGLQQALYEVRFIPYLVRPHSQGPLNIKIRNHSITNKQGSIWNRSNLLTMEEKARIFPSEITSRYILEPTDIFF